MHEHQTESKNYPKLEITTKYQIKELKHELHYGVKAEKQQLKKVKQEHKNERLENKEKRKTEKRGRKIEKKINKYEKKLERREKYQHIQENNNENSIKHNEKEQKSQIKNIKQPIYYQNKREIKISYQIHENIPKSLDSTSMSNEKLLFIYSKERSQIPERKFNLCNSNNITERKCTKKASEKDNNTFDDSFLFSEESSDEILDDLVLSKSSTNEKEIINNISLSTYDGEDGIIVPTQNQYLTESYLSPEIALYKIEVPDSEPYSIKQFGFKSNKTDSESSSNK